MLNFLWISYSDISPENKWVLIAQYCNELLSRCDWTQIPDSGLSFTQQTNWLDYRQALKEVKETFVNPDDVKLPEPPEGER
jgi:hypothetical protein